MASRIPKLGTGSIVSPDGRPLTNFQGWVNRAFTTVEKTVTELATQLGLIETAQATADDAQSKAELALSTIASFASDGVLTPVEKKFIMREAAIIEEEQFDLDDKANLYGVSTTSYDNAVSALTAYLGTLTTPTAWNDLAGTTTIDGATFTQKFADAYSTENLLRNAIYAAAKAGIDSAEAAASAAQSAADAAAAEAASNTAELAEIASDSVLTRGDEKRRVIREYADILTAQTDDDAKATLYGITTEKTNYDNAITALTAYLATLTYPGAWNVQSANTSIVAATWNAKWSDVYSKRVLLLNKIAVEAKARADAAQSAADAAQLSATDALADLANIASDDILSRGEKPRTIREYAEIIATQTGIDARATAFGITTEKTAYDNAITALTSYLGTLTSPVAWNNLSADTTIVGTTFKTKFSDVVLARDALQLKIAEKAGDRATWSNVTGLDKPENGATRNVNRGAWAASTAYAVGDFFTYNGSSYSVTIAHTSSAGSPPPNANVTLLASQGPTGPTGSTGAAGVNAITGILTNEAHVVATASNGSAGFYLDAGGTFRVFDGITEKTTSGLVTYSVVSSPSWISINSSGVYTVTDPGADTATATLRAVYGGVTTDRVYSISKSKSGLAGSPGNEGASSRTIRITADRSIISYDSSGALAPSTQTVTFALSRQNTTGDTTVSLYRGDGTVLSAAGYITRTGGSSGVSGNDIVMNDATVISMTAADFHTARGSSPTVVVKATQNTFSDQITITKVQELDAAAGTKLSGIAPGAGTSFVWTSIGSASVTIRGNSFERASGASDYNACVVGPALHGTAFVSQRLIPGVWNMLTLDNAATSSGYASQSFMLQIFGTAFILYSDGAEVINSSNAALTGGSLLMLAYDGTSIRGFVDGTQLFSYTTGVSAGLVFYPKVHAYGHTQTITDIQAGPFAGAGASPLVLSAIGSGLVTGNTVSSTVSGRHGAYGIEPLVGSGQISWTHAHGRWDVGFATSANKATATTYVDFAYCLEGDNPTLYWGEGAPFGNVGSVASGDRLSISYDGVNVRYYKTSGGTTTTLRTIAASPNLTLYPKVLLSGASAIKDLIVSPYTDNAWATIGGPGKAADNATVNNLTYSASAPSSPVNGDIWVDTSVTPNVTKLRVSGAWQAGGNLVTQGSHIGVEDGADVTSAIAGPPEIVINCDYTGAPLTGQLPKTSAYKLFKNGVSITSGVTWSRSTISGSATTSISGTGTATFDVSAIVSDGSIRLQAAYAGTTRVFDVVVKKALASPPSGGTGGSGNPGTTATDSSITSVSSTSYGTANAGVLGVKAGTSGRVDLSAALSYTRSTSSLGTSTAHGKWQWRTVGGVFADVTTEITAAASANTIGGSGDPIQQEAGSISVTMAKTGLTSGTDYEFQLLLRGSNTVTLNFSGSATAAGS